MTAPEYEEEPTPLFFAVIHEEELLVSNEQTTSAQSGPMPSVGRIVHYVSHGTPVRGDGSQAYTSECRAAIVTAVRDEASENGQCVSLCVLNPTGQFFNEHICQNEAKQGGTWHWPERV